MRIEYTDEWMLHGRRCWRFSTPHYKGPWVLSMMEALTHYVVYRFHASTVCLIAVWHWITGAWRWFRPGRCRTCDQVTLVFRHPDPDAGQCEDCWLDFK